jgi:hypothetical protein
MCKIKEIITLLIWTSLPVMQKKLLQNITWLKGPWFSQKALWRSTRLCKGVIISKGNFVTTGRGGARLLAFNDKSGGFCHYIIAKRENGGYIFSVYDMKAYLRDRFSIK